MTEEWVDMTEESFFLTSDKTLGGLIIYDKENYNIFFTLCKNLIIFSEKWISTNAFFFTENVKSLWIVALDLFFWNDKKRYYFLKKTYKNDE